MSFEDLQAHDIFLPESEWGDMELKTPVNRVALSAAFIVAAASCTMMVMGDGRSLTWIGAGLFIAFLFAFVWLSNVGIERQNERIEELRQENQSA